MSRRDGGAEDAFPANILGGGPCNCFLIIAPARFGFNVRTTACRMWPRRVLISAWLTTFAWRSAAADHPLHPHPSPASAAVPKWIAISHPRRSRKSFAADRSDRRARARVPVGRTYSPHTHTHTQSQKEIVVSARCSLLEKKFFLPVH